MRSLICYESMYGNTREVAEAIGSGLASTFEVAVAPISEVTDEMVRGSDLVVVGAPTHAHGMPRPVSRDGAASRGLEHGAELEPGAHDDGVREWLARAEPFDNAVAAFDTRVDMNPLLSGQASHAISRRLRRLGGRELVDPESFLVDKDDTLLDGELARASQWGARIADVMGA